MIEGSAYQVKMTPNVKHNAKNVILKKYSQHAKEEDNIEDILNNRRYGRLSSYIKICEESNEPFLWVFGYGSLIWKPKFEYDLCAVGYVQKQARRFWQGNCTHRGTPESPGRVATLIDDDNSRTWGRSYRLKGLKQISLALDHLCNREVEKGGYDTKLLEFKFRNGQEINETTSVHVITFVATSDSSQYLGPAPIDEVAKTIVTSRGDSGHNLEYLFRLTDSLRELAPESEDVHLDCLEEACHRLLSLLITGQTTNGKDDCRTDDEYVTYCLMTRFHHINAAATWQAELSNYNRTS